MKEYVVIGIAFLLCVVMLYLKEKSIKNCLLWACSEAEKALGSGTGKLKLRMVYDKFVEKYPIVSTIVPFSVFSSWVDSALGELKEMISNNDSIRSYIEKGDNE